VPPVAIVAAAVAEGVCRHTPVAGLVWQMVMVSGRVAAPVFVGGGDRVGGAEIVGGNCKDSLRRRPGDMHDAVIFQGRSKRDDVRGSACRRRQQQGIETVYLWCRVGIGTEEREVLVNGRKRAGRRRGDYEALCCTRRDIDRGVQRAAERVGGGIGRLVGEIDQSRKDRIGHDLAAGGVLAPVLMIVAKAVTGLPTCADRLAGRTAATSGRLLDAGSSGGRRAPALKRLSSRLSAWPGSVLANSAAIRCCVVESMPKLVAADCRLFAAMQRDARTTSSLTESATSTFASGVRN
jgi:hypothetical protein